MKDEKTTMRSLADMLGDAEYTDICLTGNAFDGKDIVLHVRKTLPFKDAMKFVADVAGSCVNMESAEYTPSGFDFAMKLNTVMYYAELPLDNASMAKMYRLIYETNIYNHVLSVINRVQLDHLVGAARDYVDYMVNMITSTASQGVMEMISKMDGFAESMQTFTDQFGSDDFQSAMAGLKDFITTGGNHADGQKREESKRDNVILMKKKDVHGEEKQD